MSSFINITGPSPTARNQWIISLVWPYENIMAIAKIKATYSLDVVTVRALERIAELWGVSKSEAVRRAIRLASRTGEPANDALEALDELQRVLDLSKEDIERWSERVELERGEWGMESRGHDPS